MNSAAVDPHLVSVKRLVLLGQELTRQRRYATYADLKADLRDRAARLRLPYDAELLGAALDRLERGGRACVVGAPGGEPGSGGDVEMTPVVSADEARQMLARIRARLGSNADGVRTMPDAQPVRRLKADKVRALKQVFALVSAQVQRCEDAEQALTRANCDA